MGVDTKAKAAVKKPAAHPNTWVFFEGDFARYNDVKLGLMTHALHYGTAVFEGIRAYWNQQKNQLYLLGPRSAARTRRQPSPSRRRWRAGSTKRSCCRSTVMFPKVRRKTSSCSRTAPSSRRP